MKCKDETLIFFTSVIILEITSDFFLFIFLLLLFLSLKWANYQKIFVLNEPIISGYNILNKKDYKSIIDQLEYETINKAYIVEIRKALERDKFMTPVEAKDFGLIDEVVEKRS